LRRRFDREGKIIEEILFKDGNAVTKTNYSLEDSLVWVRRPLDSNVVWTEVYNYDGAMIASGHESIYNPGNLLWFQNIELTALNSASIQSREMAQSNLVYGANGPVYLGRSSRKSLHNNTPQLVQYKKQGDWTYYREYNYAAKKSPVYVHNLLSYDYRHFGQELLNAIGIFDDFKPTSTYDSVCVKYADNYLQDFCGYAADNFVHLHISYYEQAITPQNFYVNIYEEYQSPATPQLMVKECGQYNQANERIGVWKRFSVTGELYKTENYLVAWKEDDDEK
jgi:hypothetical protein